MEIQTEKERDPAVGNIIRDSPETQVDTEVFENSFGVKTAKESGIRTLHENEDNAEEDTENDEDDSDNGGAQRKPKNKKSVRPEKRADRDNDDNDEESGDTWETDSGAEKGSSDGHKSYDFKNDVDNSRNRCGDTAHRHAVQRSDRRYLLGCCKYVFMDVSRW